ncbi:MAG: hypothetical protein INH37_03975, partial [Myxococcaceae bacterium]|nr:hypothetical protein [Myxococcaceae bacterium]
MRRAALSGVLLLAACPPARVERAARVVIELDRGLRSRCLQLELEAGASTYSQPLVLTGKTPLVAGVPQGRLGDTVRVRALGFVDEACGERAREESDFATLTFVDDAVTEVRLRVTARAPRTETRCADGADDDGDGRVDCADADCDDAPCAAADRCLVSPRCAGGACRSQAVRQCRSPPTTCFAPEGACAPTDGTCSYTVAVTNTCTDQDACTTNDACQGDGGCAGTPLACPANTTLSCRASAGTCANGGCTYALTPDAGCDDGDRCTLDDRCSALGACSGVPVSCPARTCAVFTNQCGDGGACLYAPVSPGTPCDGGVCSRAGECLPRFPYQPLNFEVVAAPAPPLAPTVLDCGEVVLDSSGAAPGRPVSWCQGQPFQASLVGLDGGSEALLVSFSGLVLARDAGLRLVGDRPVIFAVFGDATLAGAVVAEGADRTCGGGSTNGAAGSAGNGGGAGGSFASAGGAGGDGTAASGGTASA